MRARIAALMSLIGGWTSMAQAQSSEERIFERPPYVDAAKAITARNAAQLERLIRDGLDVNYESHQEFWLEHHGLDTLTLPLWAYLQDSPDSIKALLQAGADPNKATRRGLTLLMVTAMGKSDELFELMLIGYKADPNKIVDDDSALTLVMTAPELGEKRWQRAEMLVRHGADVNLDLDRGETAVMSLALQGRWRAVLWLLEHGADYEARDRFDATVMRHLRNSYDWAKPSDEERIYRDKVRDWLLAHGVEPSRLDPAVNPEHRKP